MNEVTLALTVAVVVALIPVLAMVMPNRIVRACKELESELAAPTAKGVESERR